MRERIEKIIMIVLLFAAVFGVSREAGMMVSSQNSQKAEESRVVFIDVGHGGTDPGKVGVDGSLEKDINLLIAKRLKYYLEASDIRVILTRENDIGLYNENDKKKKVADMRNRCELINNSQADLVISIHQNSYHEEAVAGGQVFYYKGSEKGRELAEILQKRFDYILGEKNNRMAKANDNYYLLLHVKAPIVIAEGGFLSNWAEAKLLGTPEYQDRLAWTLHVGILEYLNRQ